MQKPFIATLVLGVAWALSRAAKGPGRDWKQVSHTFDKRLPDVIAGLKRRPGPGRKRRPEAGGVPVEPNRPNTLSGGAAAALNFDRD